jgi:hypothetical protein
MNMDLEFCRLGKLLKKRNLHLVVLKVGKFNIKALVPGKGLLAASQGT